jgi:hypothetical protein
MAFWATAPGVRFNFFATAVPDNFAFANSFSARTSSLDQATIRRLDFDFAFAIIALGKSTHHSAGACRDVNEDDPALHRGKRRALTNNGSKLPSRDRK